MRNDAVEVESVETLSDDWGDLKKSTLRFRRSSGEWQCVTRETYDRGHGAAILLYDVDRRTVVLTRQFQFPVFANGEPGDRVGAGGGDAGEGEDIEVLELPFNRALAMIGSGEIRDAKTIILLYHARETVLRETSTPG